MLLIYSKTITRGWTSPCHPPPSQRMHMGIRATWATLCPTARHMLPALSQTLSAGGRGAGRHRAPSPQVEQHVGLLVEDHFDVAGADQVIVHLIPLPIAGLQEKRQWGQAVSRDSPGLKSSRTAPVGTAPLPKTHRWPRAGKGTLREQTSMLPAVEHSLYPPSSAPHNAYLLSTLLSAHYRDPRAPTSPQPRAGAKRVPWAHLHVAVVVPRVAAVSGVHQHCIESIHDRIPIVLRHVRADIQELGVPHILRREDVSGTCAAGGSLATARAAQLSYESHLSREGDLLFSSRGHSKEDARMSQTPTAQLGKGCRTAAELTLRTGPPPTLPWAAEPRARDTPSYGLPSTHLCDFASTKVGKALQ